MKTPTDQFPPAAPGTTRARIEAAIRPLLPKSQQGKVPRIALRVANLYAAPWMEASSVEVRGARVTVQTVEAYGLTIELDANGNATTVHFPDRCEPLDVDPGDFQSEY